MIMTKQNHLSVLDNLWSRGQTTSKNHFNCSVFFQWSRIVEYIAVLLVQGIRETREIDDHSRFGLIVDTIIKKGVVH